MPETRRVWIFILIVAFMSMSSCRGGDDVEEVAEGNLEYYCAHWPQAWCPALLDCSYDNFIRSFQSMEECHEQVRADCLEPPEGVDACIHATEEETDLCVEYLNSNHPDGCNNLFGPSADMSPCEAICVRD